MQPTLVDSSSLTELEFILKQFLCAIPEKHSLSATTDSDSGQLCLGRGGKMLSSATWR